MERFHTNHKWNWIKYHIINDHYPLQVDYHLDKKIVKIQGSIPYFMNGHNFYSSRNDLRYCIDYMSNSLDLDIKKFSAKNFENGVVVQSPVKFSVTKNTHHINNPKIERKIFEYSKYFMQEEVWTVLYDYLENRKRKVKPWIKKYLLEKGLIKEGFNYVKIENQYKKPEKYFGSCILVSDLMSKEFEKKLNIDLISKYCYIEKRKSIKFPTLKSEANISQLMYKAFMESHESSENTPFDLITEQIELTPKDLLSKQNKYIRRSNLNKRHKKIQFEEHSKYDLLFYNSIDCSDPLIYA